MKRSRALVVLVLALLGCEGSVEPEPTPIGPTLTMRVDGLPQAQRISQLGLELNVNLAGPNGIADLSVTIDRGTTAARVVRPRDALPEYVVKRGDNPFWVLGPFSNGSHTFTFTASDSSGTVRETTATYIVDVPDKSYRVTPILAAGVDTITVNDINLSGLVVGTARVGGRDQAFAWEQGVLRHLPDPVSGSVYGSSAAAVNDSGVIVGAFQAAQTSSRPAMWRGTTVTVFPGTPFDLARDVNLAGQFVTGLGIYNSSGIQTFSFAASPTSTFQWAGTYFSSINNAGIAAGAWGNQYRPYGYAGTAPSIGGGTPPTYWRGAPSGEHDSRLLRINDQSDAIGRVDNTHYFYWHPSVRYWLVNPFADGRADLLNNNRQVVGFTKGGAPYLWTIGGGVTRIVVPGHTVLSARAMNDRGQVLAVIQSDAGIVTAAVLDPL